MVGFYSNYNEIHLTSLARIMIHKGIHFQLSITAIRKLAYFTKDMTDYFLKATIMFFFCFFKANTQLLSNLSLSHYQSNHWIVFFIFGLENISRTTCSHWGKMISLKISITTHKKNWYTEIRWYLFSITS